MRACFLLFLFSALAFASVRLYLKDGDYQIAREYQIQGDRVRYYSTERGDWEEIPLSLVDLEKTKQEERNKADQIQKDKKEEAEEDQAQLELKREIASVPEDTGAYFRREDKVVPLEAGKYDLVTSKTRNVLKVLTPIPIIPGKTTVILKGEHAPFLVRDERPTFYFRPEREESFGIVRLTPRKGHRVVENISIVPRVNVGYQSRDEVPVFQQQIAGNLYKVWPEKPIEPGEYAVIEYNDDETDPNQMQLMVWDFADER